MKISKNRNINEEKITKIKEEKRNSMINPAQIKTFKNMGRRGSKYNLLEEAKAIANLESLKEKDTTLNFKDDKNTLSFSMSSSENISTTKKKKISPLKENLLTPLHEYKENKLPVITNSKQINDEIDIMTKRSKYYHKFVADNNFGNKYVKKYPKNETYDQSNEEEFLQLMGLNDEEKDPLSVINNKINRMNERIEIKRDHHKYLLFQTAKKRAFIKDNKEKYHMKGFRKNGISVNYDYLMKTTNKKISKKKKEVIYSLMKKDEFSDFLIMNYLRVYYPKILKNSEKEYNNKIFPLVGKSQKLKKKKIAKRKIFVIKDSTVISNPRQIPGFIAEIPTIKEMNSFPRQKRILIMRQFYEFAADKFRTHLTFKYIYNKDRNCLIDFADLPENQKYIFVSPSSIFQGLSIPLNKNIIQLYLKHFTEEEDDNYYFNESSNEESFENDKNIKNMDDVYDIFLKKNLNPKPKKFKTKLKNKKPKLNSSFTFGLENQEYEYIIYSDDEQRKKDFHENHYKYYNNKLDFFVESQNELFDTRIKLLLSQLTTNGDGKIKNYKKYRKYKKSKSELINSYLNEKNLPKKNMLKDLIENKPLKGQDILDAIHLLKFKDQKFDVNKFVLKEKASKRILPFVEKNIKDNTDKYTFNRKKTDSEYPCILSYNLPMVVEKHQKYSLNDLIKYYTKFKSLVNLWFNMHENTDVVQYGIDFETFHRCTEDLCGEEEVLARKIFDKINSGTSGILSLEDYVDALNNMNRNNTIDQIEFFLKIFNSKDKESFSYEDILEISKISIRRLIKNRDNSEINDIVEDLGSYLTEFVFKVCGSEPKDGISINKLKNVLMNDKKNLEYLKIFMCSFGKDKANGPKKDEFDLEKFKNGLKISIEDELDFNFQSDKV